MDAQKFVSGERGMAKGWVVCPISQVCGMQELDAET